MLRTHRAATHDHSKFEYKFSVRVFLLFLYAEYYIQRVPISSQQSLAIMETTHEFATKRAHKCIIIIGILV